MRERSRAAWIPCLILVFALAAKGRPHPETGVSPPSAGSPAAEPAAAAVWDVESCAGCHDAQIEALAADPHSSLDAEGSPTQLVGSASCIACHGDPTAHIESGGEEAIFAFGIDDLPTVKSNQCLSCHGNSHPRFFASRHAAAGIDCATCHPVHPVAESEAPEAVLRASERRGLLAWDPEKRSASASCSECHTDVFAQFELNERHRLQEGVLDCASCHDPHEPNTRLALGGFKQQQCTSCHADKDGPFVFEHGAQRVEGCVACHDPHGSPNRFLLNYQRVADLCYSCHMAVPGFHLRFTADSQCTSCHSTIHGSNFDPYFLK